MHRYPLHVRRLLRRLVDARAADEQELPHAGRLGPVRHRPAHARIAAQSPARHACIRRCLLSAYGEAKCRGGARSLGLSDVPDGVEVLAVVVKDDVERRASHGRADVRRVTPHRPPAGARQLLHHTNDGTVQSVESSIEFETKNETADA